MLEMRERERNKKRERLWETINKAERKKLETSEREWLEAR